MGPAVQFSRDEGEQTLWLDLILGTWHSSESLEGAASALLVHSWWVPSDSPPSRSQIPCAIRASWGSHMHAVPAWSQALVEKERAGLASRGHQPPAPSPMEQLTGPHSTSELTVDMCIR